ncbi:hypothetical protein KGMB01110_26300 [Mediterraneibacter butyricigenes]|uniref:Transcriptional regulator n=1 Tax=Mediterraneibacter butyricigenes TaxID=2316025 RepID=A0A391P2D4_9FIRM|nr:helix-turn-helix transcriptional regulator [Mediterraneibacter butyricigenes]RGO28484.1 transcriptional regulator [Dorea sp. OM02-2LB]RGV98669.1 transcriptional regulator [Ruminococcus sp. AF14-10]GCA68194.1 hypothetical protein KGMB01110_26300 [Mediterraneibacter butyricigenes]
MEVSRLEFLKQIAHALAVQFGDNCEVLVHDLARNSVENSIVYIENGHVTGRALGGSPSRAVLDVIRHPDGAFEDQLSYLTKTENGRILKSSTIYIKDEHGKPRYILSINFDITNLIALESSLHSLTAVPEPSVATPQEAPKVIPHDVNELLDELIQQSVALVGVPVALMTKDDKIKAIKFLNETGAFLITRSGDKVAKYFEISKYTLYSYINMNKES